MEVLGGQTRTIQNPKLFSLSSSNFPYSFGISCNPIPNKPRRAARRQGRRRKTLPQALFRLQPSEPAPATERASYPAPQLKEPP
ncbi:hypothetical protein TIFTF001_025800 [Ficus carica]|uniref:Uncharacterized protein n=1 Tax=Ficus carica TaxID=3494 RepID=A0AA88B1M4_FICCA|nr:hypothetical protein TIFTF001_025800 [Ficus carica]